jgi:succinate dehydrogenase / fumarate reductase iron-sulfur subunit
VVRDHDENKEAFAGPRYLMRIRTRHASAGHPGPSGVRVAGARPRAVQHHQVRTEVCPERIKITDNALIPMKERVVDHKYDPVVWLGNKLFWR